MKRELCPIVADSATSTPFLHDIPPASGLEVETALQEGSVPLQHFTAPVWCSTSKCIWWNISLPVFLLQPEVKVSISRFMSHVHMSVKEMSKTYLAVERRYNYTTPKTFLEQIKLYQNLLSKQRSELTAKIERLEKGLTKLQSTTSQVPPRVPQPGTEGQEERCPHRMVNVGCEVPKLY